MGNCHPKRINVDRAEAEVDIGFHGVTISHVILSCSQSLSYLTKCLLNVSYIFRLVSKQSRSSEYMSLYFVLCTFKRSNDASQNLL